MKEPTKAEKLMIQAMLEEVGPEMREMLLKTVQEAADAIETEPSSQSSEQQKETLSLQREFQATMKDILMELKELNRTQRLITAEMRERNRIQKLMAGRMK